MAAHLLDVHARRRDVEHKFVQRAVLGKARHNRRHGVALADVVATRCYYVESAREYVVSHDGRTQRTRRLAAQKGRGEYGLVRVLLVASRRDHAGDATLRAAESPCHAAELFVGLPQHRDRAAVAKEDVDEFGQRAHREASAPQFDPVAGRIVHDDPHRVATSPKRRRLIDGPTAVRLVKAPHLDEGV